MEENILPADTVEGNQSWEIWKADGGSLQRQSCGGRGEFKGAGIFGEGERQLDVVVFKYCVTLE